MLPMSFRPTATWANLKLRAALLSKIRKFFDERGFLEVETPILSADVVVDRHLDPMSTVLADDPRRPDVGRRLWLQTSPEFAMKRLLAAGDAKAIYQVTRAFRNGEIGPLHNPEFTILEWYRVDDDMDAGMSLLAEFCEAILNTLPAERISYSAAFEQHAGFNPHTATVKEMAAVAERKNLSIPQGLGEDRDHWLNWLLTECVELHLGQSAPTILYDYPASQAALAKVRSKPQPVAERFELYIRSVELANGYHELLDPSVLRQRNVAANAARVAEGKPALPEDSRLLQAMDAGLPPCTGVALGFDRLVMIAAGAKSLAEVMAFPIDIA